MLTDDEKFFHTPTLSLEDVYNFTIQNATDIIAVGFDMKKTFIFSDISFVDGGYASAFNTNVRKLAKRTTMNQVRGTFGFNDKSVAQIPWE